MTRQPRLSRPFRPALAQLLIAAAVAGAVLPAPGLAQGHSASGQDLYAGVTSVEVFANSAMLVSPAQSSHYQLAIYRLDAMQHIEAVMNNGLPQNEADAMRWVAQNEQRLRRQLQPMIAGAVTGMALAHQYQIDRLPAVVVNRRYVVFGYANVDQALQALRTSQAKAGS